MPPASDELDKRAAESTVTASSSEDGQAFGGEITVSSRIIDQLSSGLYETPAACLKELINNSYDADATRVTMSVRPDAEIIIIDDNGEGITRPAFVEHFERIARSHKRDDGDLTKRGRSKIGKIGIGFIAANEICDQLEIVSTVRGSTELLEVSIDFADMRTDAEERKREGEDVAKGDYIGRVSKTAQSNEHFTQVFLRGVRGEAREILRGAKKGRSGASLYGLKPDSIRDRLAAGLTGWSELDSYSRAMLEIGLNVPVQYHKDWLPSTYKDDVREFTEKAEKLDFDVNLDGTELRKPIVLTPGPDGKSLLRVFRLQGDHVAATGYLYASSGRLIPIELNGVLIRIRKAAAGDYDRSFLDYPSWIDKLFQGWISCEIYADDRLEPALNIDRRTLRPTHEAFVELQAMFHEELKSFFAEVRTELYRKRSEKRRKERAKEQSRQLDELGDRLEPTIGRDGADDVLGRFRNPPRPSTGKSEPPRPQQENINISRLTARYSPAEVLKMVTDSAREIGLDATSTRALLAEVARRLRG